MNRYITWASYIALALVAAGCTREPICCDGGYEYRHAGRTAESPKPDERDAKIAMLEQERQQQTESLAALRSQVEELERQLAAQEATRVTPVAQAQRGLGVALRPEIEKGDITVDVNSERLLIKLASTYLFDSGHDALRPAGIDALKRTGEILKDYPQYQMEVTGHTDNVPIGSKLLPRFADNEALSTARAEQAARVLQDSGVDPSKLLVRGYGDAQPLATNDNEDGRRMNRRVEIRVTPKR